MKILTISDVESKYFWDFYDKTKFEDIDLIISCGDLKAEYLTFLETMTSLPLLYVHGNHDNRYEEKAPEGCVCIEDRIYEYKGVRFLGLGGSMRYKDGKYQYTEKEMEKRYNKLKLKLKLGGGVDVLVTHSPAAGHGDADDLPHHGFKVFEKIMDDFEPKYFLHGHVHMNYGPAVQRESRYKNTTIINAYEKYVFEY
ncbi:MAG: metallophosphoesterase family protein [Lachnospiraceae bacterium]|nr:metallophosphoesterase family protein [Lachnospiraceae bacterium]